MSVKTIFPAFFRQNLFPRGVHNRIDEILEKGRADGLNAVFTNLVKIEHGLSQITRIYFQFGEGASRHHLTLSSDNFPSHLKRNATDIIFDIASPSFISVYLDGAYSHGEGVYSLHFYRGCTILSGDHTQEFALKDYEALHKSPENLALRAKICSVFMSEEDSHHQRFAIANATQRAIADWATYRNFDQDRPVGAGKPNGPKNAIRLGIPDAADLAACTSSISTTNPHP